MQMTAEHVLVADDEPHIVELISLYLRRAGYTVSTASDGDETLRVAESIDPALVILDIMMPGQDGLQVCRALRARGAVPVVFLTARSSDIDKITGLKLGADDYITKPFNPDELVARVEAVLRRSNARLEVESERVALGDLQIDAGNRLATIAGRDLVLTPREFDLLLTLARFPGRALHREQLLDLVWGATFYSHRSVDVHVARIREKLRGSVLQIETVWGSGYRLLVSEPAALATSLAGQVEP